MFSNGANLFILAFIYLFTLLLFTYFVLNNCQLKFIASSMAIQSNIMKEIKLGILLKLN